MYATLITSLSLFALCGKSGQLIQPCLLVLLSAALKCLYIQKCYDHRYRVRATVIRSLRSCANPDEDYEPNYD